MQLDFYFIDVILPLPLERNYTYAVTPAEAKFIKKGMRVAVPFGKQNIYTALVYAIHKNKPINYEAKSIHSILDSHPIISYEQLQLWEWISKYYMTSLGEVLNAALPSTFLLQSETLISLNTKEVQEPDLLNDEEYLIVDALQQQSRLKIQEISALTNKKQTLPIINRLLERKTILVEHQMRDTYQPKKIRYVRLASTYNHEDAIERLTHDLKRAPKQREIVLSYFGMKSKNTHIKVADLLSNANASTSQIKALIDKQILEDYFIETDRVIYDNSNQLKPKTLNPYQQVALEAVEAVFKQQSTCLLHGVTSSGKTELYIKLIAKEVSHNRQVLYLVPEIALTSQLVQRLINYFGNKIAVYHSKYSANERTEVWHHLLQQSEQSQIVIGARSSVLLPFSNLGLIIIDEEHETSYKQFDPSPRYHARDTALVLSKLHRSKTLLGSATPSIESFFNAKIQKKYGYVFLSKRHNNVLMPEIELVDLKDKYKRKRMTGHFSDRLIDEITSTLESKSQVILFQNRRGYSPVVTCQTCGHSPNCPNCDVTLTFHQYKNHLKCHYCSYTIAMQQTCGACGSPELDQKGFGTEQIQEEVMRLFPEVKVARMDLDTTRGKYSYEKIINSFENRDVDILVGTQMLTKGLDFRHVKLVGVLNADQLINFPDFRAHERSFQMLLQVAGRAGRTDQRGRVLIQTFNPYHTILQHVSVNAYEAMFDEQLDQRYLFKYPPYFKLIKITLKHKDYEKVNKGAEWIAEAHRNYFGTHVLGPEFPPVSRIRNHYHKNILIKIPQGQSLSKTKKIIQKLKTSFQSISTYRSVRILINVDNY
jgi:primosomal protein N' (replication factor Y)